MHAPLVELDDEFPHQPPDVKGEPAHENQTLPAERLGRWWSPLFDALSRGEVHAPLVELDDEFPHDGNEICVRRPTADSPKYIYPWSVAKALRRDGASGFVATSRREATGHSAQHPSHASHDA